jgi:SAM-dependent methyltransferase
MTEAFSGSYPIESRGGEIERLHIQSAAMVPDTERMLELIGVRGGWSCLDIGCGPGGIVGLLSKRVGSTGRVVGLDMNTGFLEHARATAPSNVEFVLADAYGSTAIGTKQTFDQRRLMSAIGGKADIALTRGNVRL